VHNSRGIYIEDTDAFGSSAGGFALNFIAVQYGHICRSKVHHSNWCLGMSGEGPAAAAAGGGGGALATGNYLFLHVFTMIWAVQAMHKQGTCGRLNASSTQMPKE
jgi:hypothetical protein